jgi:glycine cleavage system H protein
MPVSGKVIETNKKLLQTPTFINADPYGEGWMMNIEIKNKAELENLISAEQYKLIINQ